MNETTFMNITESIINGVKLDAQLASLFNVEHSQQSFLESSILNTPVHILQPPMPKFVMAMVLFL